jgi:hypothetical protein
MCPQSEPNAKRELANRIPRMVCLSRGLYARVARRMKCDVSYVSRIARGERRSAKIEAELGREFRVVLRKLRLMLNPL